MFLLAIAFLLGHCLLHAVPQLPHVDGSLGLVGALTVSAVLCLPAVLYLAMRRPRARFGAAIALMFAAGFGSAWWSASDRVAERWPDELSGTDVEVRGYIASIVETHVDGKRFLFDVVSPDRTAAVRAPRHIELNWYDATSTPAPGELWQLRVRLRSSRGFANPGGYDYEAQLLRKNIGATGYVREASGNRRLDVARWSYVIVRARALIAARLANALPNSPMLGIVQGLAVGDTSRMTSAQWRVFAATGTTHLMAISGLHIGMVALSFASGIAWLVARCERFIPLQRRQITVIGVQAIAGMIAAIVYSALAGFSIPTQRTLIMLCVYFGARLLRREVPPTHGLAVALITVLLVDPFAPLAAGFWLSFGAVAALFFATTGRRHTKSRWREYGRLQLIATIGLAPLLIGVFGNLSLISPLVNLLAIPFYTLLVVPLVLIASVTMLVSSTLASVVLQGAVHLLEWTWPLMEALSRLPLAMWPFPQAPTWAFILLLIGTFFLLAPGVFATRIAGATLCLPALIWQPIRPGAGEFELTLLDVGQGLSIVVTTATHALVYDTGPNFRSGRDTGELVVVPYLHARGLRRIDTLVASHGDADHIGGMESLLAQVPAERLLLGPSVTPRATSETCAAGQTWQWDGVRFEMLYPIGDVTHLHRNDTSCVLRIQGIGGSALLLGDVERAAEQQLLTSGKLLASDIVIVPHHGSRTSSSPELVAATSPRYALFSAGFGNQWGFPKAEVQARWQAVGARSLQTSQGGAIEIAVTRDGLGPVRAYRAEHRHYWRDEPAK